MSSLRANMSEAYAYNIPYAIQMINEAIRECYIWKNYAAIPDLVDEIETELYPYIDKQYLKEIESIGSDERIVGSTPNEVKAKVRLLNNQRVKLKHRALMKLAYRHRFLPSSSKTKDICADNSRGYFGEL